MSIIAVSKLAGVSHATVSRVMNNRPGVSPENRRLVQEAMKRLHYQPTGRRRGRRPREARNDVALLLLSAELALVQAPVFSEMLSGIEAALRQRGMNLQFAQVGHGAALPANVAQGQVQGLILIGSEPDAPERHRLASYPTVWLGSRHSRSWGDSVQADDFRVGELAAEHLIELGHRRLAVMVAEPEHPAMPMRAHGFRALAERHGLEVRILRAPSDTRREPLAPFSDEQACHAIVQQFCKLRPRPTGLFVPADLVTGMVQRELLRAGVDLRGEVKLVSANHEQVLLAPLDPRPVSVDVRANLIGRRAVDQLLWRIRHPHEPGIVRVLVQPRLVREDSTVLE